MYSSPPVTLIPGQRCHRCRPLLLIGHVAVTAIRADDLDAVVTALIRYAESYGARAREIDPADNDDRATVVAWPNYFSGNVAGADRLSREFDTVASAVDIYDGDFWNHVLWRGGKRLDHFSSHPDYFTTDRREARRLRQEWAGSPAAVAEAFGVPVEHVTPYLIAPYSSGLSGWWLRRRRPFPDDVYELWDPWVYLDLWRRMGIDFPEGRGDRSVWISEPGMLPTGGPSM
jgi:hypothetical protein